MIWLVEIQMPDCAVRGPGDHMYLYDDGGACERVGRQAAADSAAVVNGAKKITVRKTFDPHEYEVAARAVKS